MLNYFQFRKQRFGNDLRLLVKKPVVSYNAFKGTKDIAKHDKSQQFAAHQNLIKEEGSMAFRFLCKHDGDFLARCY